MQIKTIIPLSVPMWAVNYNYDEDAIDFTPIIALALITNEDLREIIPIPFISHRRGQDEKDLQAYMEDPWFLGFTLSPNASDLRGDFNYRINRIRKEEEKLTKEEP